MLIKRNDFMTPAVRPVKKMAVSLLSALAVSTAAIAPAAFAGESPLIDRTVTVKFNLSDLADENGVQKTYAKIHRKAKTYCRADGSSLQYLRQSKKECTDDLMEQFIENADVESLKAYHVAQTNGAKI